MENLRIFESLIILNERIEGFLARIDFLSNDPENPRSELKFLAILQDNKKIMKEKRLFYEHFPEDKRDGYRAVLKPYVETLLQISELPNQIFNLLKNINDNRFFLYFFSRFPKLSHYHSFADCTWTFS